jgi:hypothetical protein
MNTWTLEEVRDDGDAKIRARVIGSDGLEVLEGQKRYGINEDSRSLISALPIQAVQQSCSSNTGIGAGEEALRRMIAAARYRMKDLRISVRLPPVESLQEAQVCVLA